MTTKLNVLVACESSGTVREAFRRLGHNAWSCDLLPCDDSSPYHIQGDALNAVASRSWDLVIAHPPRTYLTNAGVTWLHSGSCGKATGVRTYMFSDRRSPEVVEQRWQAMREAAHFFRSFINAFTTDIVPHVAIENPIMHCYARNYVGSKYDQIIQPWQFGHLEQKATCLWLYDLPLLKPTVDVVAAKAALKALPRKDRMRLHYLSPTKDRWKLRSKTFEGIANAMATQWSKFILNENQTKTSQQQSMQGLRGSVLRDAFNV